MTDAFSRVLAVLRPERARFAQLELRAPWQADAAPRGLLVYYHVVEGACTLRAKGQAPLALSAGGVALVTRGDAHELGDASAGCRLVRGELACDAILCEQLLSRLPRLALANVSQEQKTGWLHTLIASALAPQPGGEWLLSKASEMLLVEALLRHLAGGPLPREEWLLGLRDRVVSRCLSAMYDRPADKWTLERLAREANTSRSVLVERFTRLVGRPPMSYLTRWRMRLAADLLHDSTLAMTRIAEEVGYETDTAFSRAFRREFGKPPAAWRRDRLAGAAAGPANA